MLFHNTLSFLGKTASHSRENQYVLKRPVLSSKPTGTWVKRCIRRLSIAKKISYGYSLAIGIGVFGTTAGLLIGDYYQTEAQEQLTLVDRQQHLLRRLENAVATVRSHPQRLVTLLGQPILFNKESTKFREAVSQIKTQLSALDSFIAQYPHDLAVETTEFKALLHGYKTNTEAYTHLIHTLWQPVNSTHLNSQQILAARQQVLVSITSESATQINSKFEQLTERLNQLITAAEVLDQQANDQLDTVEALRRQIILASMLLSTTIAVVLALYTSRAIARPLEAVTQVARTITQEGKFDLQVPVSSEDEVGSLATSLNQLVQWVGKYTQDLEQARQTSEQGVEQRTQELTTTLNELKTAQAQLIQTEKMSSLGQLVAGVAHEINNPINFIYGNLAHANDYTQDLIEVVQLYQQHYPYPAPELQEQIEAIDLDFLLADLPKLLLSMRMGTERIREIVLSLRNFSRLDEAEMKAVDIHEGLDNTLLILNHRLKYKIEVIKEYGEVPLVECYPAQLNQVFMNILANAIDALLTLDTQRSKQIVIHTQKVDSQRVRIGIRDNGTGIPLEIRDKLFDPFFTTKPVGKGTGLGLSICYQIVEKHQGKIELVSEIGQGTEFGIILPIGSQPV